MLFIKTTKPQQWFFSFCLFTGDGDELITPVYIPPTRPPWTRVEYDDEDDNNNYNRKYAGRLCRGQNDEEDCINVGSSGDGDEFIPGSGKNYIYYLDTCVIYVMKF